ncbi:MAG: FAD-dependent oxidoreductase, partial [Solirubrobacteraceae bacterium]
MIVLGAGPAGEVLAGRVVEQGRRTAIVESRLVGGECSFYACMPSKALLRPAQALSEARRVPGAAQAVTGELAVEPALARREEISPDLDESGQASWLEERGITLVRGHGRLDGERRVRVDDEPYEARDAVVLAVGSGASMPPISGLAESLPWTNREATTARTLPASLIVLGGGVVGVEMAQAYRTLGVEVTLLEAAPRLLAREEPFASEQVHAALRELGADVRLGVSASAVRRDASGVTVELGDSDRVQAQEILGAVGWRPLTDDLGLE